MVGHQVNPLEGFKRTNILRGQLLGLDPWQEVLSAQPHPLAWPEIQGRSPVVVG